MFFTKMTRLAPGPVADFFYMLSALEFYAKYKNPRFSPPIGGPWGSINITKPPFGAFPDL